MVKTKEKEFLKESNKIEGEYSAEALEDAIKAWKKQIEIKLKFSSRWDLFKMKWELFGFGEPFGLELSDLKDLFFPKKMSVFRRDY